jgi:peptide/nickel transport system substrate-binding protein
VKWNFDRLNIFIEEGRTQIADLYKPLAGIYPTTLLLINETVVVNNFTVKFVLNYPFPAFMQILCFTGSVILSPHSTPTDTFLEAGVDLLVGTGPFVHVTTTAEKTIFTANQNYYRGTPAVQHMEWVTMEDTTAISNALLAGEIDFGEVSTDFLEDFENSPNITVGQPLKGTTINYMGMNNKLIEIRMRQAISYAIDYNYIIEDLLNGTVVRMNSPIPEGITYYNRDVKPATYNVAKARNIIIGSGFSEGMSSDSTDQDWLNLAENNPIASYNYSYDYGNAFREEFGHIVKENLKSIGINVILTGMDLSAYSERLNGDFNKLALFVADWTPEYNDPGHCLYTLFSNTSPSNIAQVNHPGIQAKILETIDEPIFSLRKGLYFDLQEYIVEYVGLMPWVFLYVPIIQNVLANTITNWTDNPMGQLEFFSITFHNEDAIIDDPLGKIDCGFEAVWDYYTAPVDTVPPSTHGDIPGYSLVAVISMATLTIMSVASRGRRKSH